MKVGTSDVVRLYKREWKLSTDPGGVVNTTDENPTGKLCSPVGSYINYGTNFYECMETEVLELKSDANELMHRRTTLSFDPDGGSGGSSQVKTWGVEDVVTPPEPAKDTCEFNGWSTSSGNITPDVSFPFTAPSMDKTYYAAWDCYVYAFGAWTAWSNDATCSESGPTVCNSDNYQQTQKECQCLWGSWSSFTSIITGESENPICSNGIVKKDIQKRTRTVSEYSYDCNGYNCNPYDCNPHDCNCSTYNCNPYNCEPYACNPHDCNCTSYACNPHDCNSYFCNPYDCNCSTYNCNPYDCNCTCSWSMDGGGYFSSTDQTGSSGCTWKTTCTFNFTFKSYQCQDYYGTESCDTCYQTCETCDTCYETCYETCYDTCQSCDTCYDTCYNTCWETCETCDTCYDTCYETCYETCYGCNYDNWSVWSSVSSCTETTHNLGDACDGMVTVECQERTSTAYTQARTRDCLRT